MIDEDPADYLVVHITEALALDLRTSAQDLDVRLRGGVICVDGVVADGELLEAVAAVTADHARGHPVQIDVVVKTIDEADVVEDLR